LRDVEGFAADFIEQPVPRDNLDAMASFVAALDTPILATKAASIAAI
jgi:L-alanine-DL-glutamate epimerase and related enzymes of enolase superfamily